MEFVVFQPHAPRNTCKTHENGYISRREPRPPPPRRRRGTPGAPNTPEPNENCKHGPWGPRGAKLSRSLARAGAHADQSLAVFQKKPARIWKLLNAMWRATKTPNVVSKNVRADFEIAQPSATRRPKHPMLIPKTLARILKLLNPQVFCWFFARRRRDSRRTPPYRRPRRCTKST